MDSKITLKMERIKSVATIIVTAIANVLNVYGFSVDADLWAKAVTSVLAVASIAGCWWFNQNWTKAAVKGQQVVNAEKAKAKSGDPDGE